MKPRIDRFEVNILHKSDAIITFPYYNEYHTFMECTKEQIIKIRETEKQHEKIRSW